MATARTVYVDTDVVGGNQDGTSWANAYPYIQIGLETEATDLTVSDEVLTFLCRGSAADGSTTDINLGDGWVTDSTRYIIVEPETFHSGKWDASIYHLERSWSANAFYCNVPFTRLRGLQIKNTSTSTASYAASITAPYPGTGDDYVLLERCIIWTDYGTPFRATGSGLTLRIKNCLGIGNSNNPVFSISNTDNNTKVFHCTAIGGTYGFSNTGSAANNQIINCCSIDGVTGGFSGTWATGSDYNASDNSDAPGANSQSGEPTMVDKAGGDYRLASGDTVCKNNGDDLSAHGTLPVDDDCEGTSRPQGSTSDIGYSEVTEGAATTAYVYALEAYTTYDELTAYVYALEAYLTYTETTWEVNRAQVNWYYTPTGATTAYVYALEAYLTYTETPREAYVYALESYLTYDELQGYVYALEAYTTYDELTGYVYALEAYTTYDEKQASVYALEAYLTYDIRTAYVYALEAYLTYNVSDPEAYVYALEAYLTYTEAALEAYVYALEAYLTYDEKGPAYVYALEAYLTYDPLRSYVYALEAYTTYDEKQANVYALEAYLTYDVRTAYVYALEAYLTYFTSDPEAYIYALEAYLTYDASSSANVYALEAYLTFDELQGYVYALEAYATYDELTAYVYALEAYSTYDEKAATVYALEAYLTYGELTATVYALEAYATYDELTAYVYALEAYLTYDLIQTRAYVYALEAYLTIDTFLLVGEFEYFVDSHDPPIIDVGYYSNLLEVTSGDSEDIISVQGTALPVLQARAKVYALEAYITYTEPPQMASVYALEAYITYDESTAYVYALEAYITYQLYPDPTAAILTGRVRMLDSRSAGFIGQDDSSGQYNPSSITTTTQQKDDLAAMGFGYFEDNRAFTITGQTAIEDLKSRNADFRWLMYTNFGHVPASDPGQARQFDSDVYALLNSNRALDTSTPTAQPVVAFRSGGTPTAYWANYHFPNTGGELFNKTLVDQHLALHFDALDALEHKPIGVKFDYFNTVAAGYYSWDGVAIDLNQDGTPYRTEDPGGPDLVEQASFEACQHYWIDQWRAKYGDDFILTGNGQGSYSSRYAALAAKLNGWYLERFPTMLWSFVDTPAEMFQELWDVRQSPSLYRECRGRIATSSMPFFHTDLLTTAGAGYEMNSDRAYCGRVAAMLFDGWWRHRSPDNLGDDFANINDPLWDAMVSAAGAPSGAPQRGTGGTVVTYFRTFSGGTYSIAFDTALSGISQVTNISGPGI
jgi:cob(I)alamin adenosyltransferase